MNGSDRMMRIKKDKIIINNSKVIDFFEKRARNYNENNPLVTTMYNDDNPHIVIERDNIEREKLTPLLNLDNTQKVLDIGCGIGRWLISLENKISYGLGIDGSSGLIDIAKKQSFSEKLHFETSNVDNISYNLEKRNMKFDRIIISGLLMYLNDEQVLHLFKSISLFMEKKCTILIREPLALQERLSLKDFWSNELGLHYNAIYRTADELLNFIEKSFHQKSFTTSAFTPLFDQKTLNNRKETQQYFCLVSFN